MKIDAAQPLQRPGAPAPHAIVPAQAQQKDPRTDKLELSRQAKEALREQQKAHMEEMARIKKEAEASREQAEAAAKAFKEWMLCIKIAGRIISGDNVPRQDEQFLLEHDPKMYQMAVSARMPKEDPEDCDSLLEDESEEKSGEAQDGQSAAAPAPSPEMPPPAEGGEVCE